MVVSLTYLETDALLHKTYFAPPSTQSLVFLPGSHQGLHSFIRSLCLHFVLALDCNPRPLNALLHLLDQALHILLIRADQRNCIMVFPPPSHLHQLRPRIKITANFSPWIAPDLHASLLHPLLQLLQKRRHVTLQHRRTNQNPRDPLPANPTLAQ